MKTHQIFEVVGLSILGLGIAIGFVDLKGGFLYGDRLSMVQLLRNQGKVDSQTSGFEAVLRKFPPPLGWKFDDVDEIAFSSLSGGLGSMVAVGPMFYSGKKGSRSACSFDEFVSWANESRYPWVNWISSLIGFLVALGGFLSGFRKQNRAS